MFKIFKYVCYLLLLWFVVHNLYCIIDGMSHDDTQADIAVILGSKVNEDGTLSPRLEKRLECGLEVFMKKRVKKIIVSGGFGKEGYYEGDKMKEFLVSKGVPDSCIITDNKGNNTLATVNNTIRICDSLNFKSIIVVSQYFHITRTKQLFKKQHMENVSGASPHYFELRDFYALTREFFAYYLN